MVRLLAVFGAWPLFFCLLHLFVLTGSNRAIGTVLGIAGQVIVGAVWIIWAIAAAVAVPCWFACRRFAAIKRASGATWMRYL